MALLSIVPDTDLSPDRAVAHALQDLQAPEHIHVSPADPTPDLDGPLWRFELTAASPDPDIAVYPGIVEHGQWRPTGQASPAEIRRGIAVQTDIGWVVAAAESEDETTTELTEQALAHVAALFGAQ